MQKHGSNPLPLANEHFVQLYRSESELTDAVASYALDVLDYDHQGILFLATRRHCDAFRRALMLQELDVGGAMDRGHVRFVQIEEILPSLLDGANVDADAFERTVTSEFHRMRSKGIRHIHVFGEVVDVLWRNGNRAATVRLEELWNALRANEEFTLYCAYLVSQSPMEAINGPLRPAICSHNALMQEVPVDGIHQRRVFSDMLAIRAKSADGAAVAQPQAAPLPL